MDLDTPLVLLPTPDFPALLGHLSGGEILRIN